MSRFPFFMFAALISLFSLSWSGSAVADESSTATRKSTGNVHRLDATLTATPFAVIGSMATESDWNGVKGFFVEIGPEVNYSFRPLRHFEFGLGGAYRGGVRLLKRSLYVHILELPMHVGLVFPLGSSVELDAACYMGFTQFWLLNQRLYEGYDRITLSGRGFYAELRISVAVHLTDTFDALAHVGAPKWQFLPDAAVMGFAFPVGFGVRARF